MTVVEGLARVEQIKRFVALAKAARRHADSSRGATRHTLLSMAEQWEKLAGCSADLTRQELADSGSIEERF
jgi:hypothetical protein